MEVQVLKREKKKKKDLYSVTEESEMQLYVTVCWITTICQHCLEHSSVQTTGQQKTFADLC